MKGGVNLRKGIKMNDLKEGFREYCTSVLSLTTDTVNDYIDRIKDYDFDDITYENFTVWIAYLKEKGNCSRTINTKISAFNIFCTFLSNAKNVSIPKQITDFKTLRVEEKQPIVLSKEDISKMINNTKDKTIKALLICYSESGVRFNELIQITYEDYLKAKKTRRYTLKGKFGKERTIAFTSQMIKAIENYLPKRTMILSKNNLNPNLLFVSKNGYKMSLGNINGSLKNIAKRCNIDNYEQISSHKFRHFFISNKNYEGHNIVDIAKYVGHSNISTTNRYLHSDNRMLESLMQA